ncbi:hypothetical protein F5Y06DRAFT_295717 [Hypoxylon sp. FL0890]|nr:hypothetical protein F5Y06DRAFT_295717 [Hypoxylon sp. FL0890]
MSYGSGGYLTYVLIDPVATSRYLRRKNSQTSSHSKIALQLFTVATDSCDITDLVVSRADELIDLRLKAGAKVISKGALEKKFDAVEFINVALQYVQRSVRNELRHIIEEAMADDPNLTPDQRFINEEN